MRRPFIVLSLLISLVIIGFILILYSLIGIDVVLLAYLKSLNLVEPSVPLRTIRMQVLLTVALCLVLSTLACMSIFEENDTIYASTIVALAVSAYQLPQSPPNPFILVLITVTTLLIVVLRIAYRALFLAGTSSPISENLRLLLSLTIAYAVPTILILGCTAIYYDLPPTRIYTAFYGIALTSTAIALLAATLEGTLTLRKTKETS